MIQREVLGLIACLTVAQPALYAQARYRLDNTRSHFSFDASSTMGSFQGSASEFHGSAQLTDTIALHDAHGSITVSLASIHTGISLRDHHLRSDLAVKDYPDITFALDSVRHSVLYGALTLHGVTRASKVAAAVHTTGDTVTVSGAIPMKFTEYGMSPPSRLFGMARVHDDWTIHFDAWFIRER